MLIDFFFTLRNYQLKVSLRELLDLLRALEHQLVFADMEAFYCLSRTLLIKDESHYDAFDKAFSDYFKGVSTLELFDEKNIPNQWLRKEIEKLLSEEQKQQLQGLGSLDALMKTLAQRLDEQKKRHQGGSRWIGTGGTSPFGGYGYHPEGVRIGQDRNRNFRAAKVWERRAFSNLDQGELLGARNMQVALRRLRSFARRGSALELDMAATIRSTANNAGYLDLQLVPERHNAVKVLMFFDVGGSMDPHIEVCEQLFSAAGGEFKHLEYFYFHNCIYESVWRDNHRRHQDAIPLWQVLHKFGRDYKVIVVGDASMGPYEIRYPGGSVEHWNDEAGEVWLSRLSAQFDKLVWLNPLPQSHWDHTQSIALVRQLVNEQMYPLTPTGITEAIKALG